MQYSEANMGRIFIVRLEHGDRLPDTIEEFAVQRNLKSALVLYLGGAERGSKVVVGPQDGDDPKPVPVVTTLAGVSEAEGVGTIFTDEAGRPKLHLHAAFGRQANSITGCTREGVTVWQIGEVIIIELVDHTAGRKIDLRTGFELLEV